MPLHRLLPRLYPPTSPFPSQVSPRPNQRLSSALPKPRIRLQQSRPRHNSKSTTSKESSASSSRAEHILSSLPPSMKKYTSRLRNAPVSHIAAFTILHELTAVIPLFALFALFHYTDYVPLGYMMEHYGGYVQDGTKRFEHYFTRKGWFGFDQEEAEEGATGGKEKRAEDAVMDKWTSSDGKYKIAVEIALAYAITKALLPVRVVGSLLATPWFAGLLVRLRGIARGFRKRK